MTDELSKEVWKCRNLPEIRRYMMNTEPISYDSHKKFIERLKEDSNSRYFVVLRKGRFVGSVNLHFKNPKTAERGIYIVPDFQGMGIAKRICIEFYQYVERNSNIRSIYTTVLKDNQPSNALESSLGAIRTAEDDQLVHYLTNVGKEYFIQG